jgi:rod shape-determining protein MreC
VVAFSRRTRELVTVALLLALPVLVLRSGLKDPSELSAFDRAILWVSSPLQSGVTGAARWVGGVWTRYVALWGVSDENAKLRDENAKLKQQVSQLEQEGARTAGLEKLLHLRETQKGELLSARVVGAEVSSYFRIMRVKVDRGELEIRQGMPVLAAAGVVGRVHRTFGNYSDVLLATDPKSSIDVVITSANGKRVKGRGVVKGIPGERRYRTRIEYLLRQDEVGEGDVVVTSGIGGFPRNLPLGKVSRVAKREFGLFQEAEVEPAVDFGKLAEVMVLIAPAASEKAER